MLHALRLAVAGVLWIVAASTPAQQYPAKTITMLCWSAAGSPVDLYARMMAKLLAAELGQNVVVDNRTGGSGIVMVNLLLRAPRRRLHHRRQYHHARGAVRRGGRDVQAGRPADGRALAGRSVRPDRPRLHAVQDHRRIRQLSRARSPNFLNVGGPFAMSGHRVAWEVFADMAKIQDDMGAVPGRRAGADRDCRRPRRRGRDQSRQREAVHRAGQGARAGGVVRPADRGFSGRADLQGARLGRGALPVARHHGESGHAEAGARPARRARYRRRSRRRSGRPTCGR